MYACIYADWIFFASISKYYELLKSWSSQNLFIMYKKFYKKIRFDNNKNIFKNLLINFYPIIL